MKSLRVCSKSILLLVVGVSTTVLGAEWEQVTGKEALSGFISDRTLEWEDQGYGKSRGEYRADGTGTLHAWGGRFDRAWKVEGNEQLWFSGDPENTSYTLERSTTDPALYRATEVTSGSVTEIRVVSSDSGSESLQLDASDAPSGSQSGPASASAAEMAQQLSNPANPIMIVFNNFDYITYDGNYPGASDKTSFQLFSQAIIPFVLEGGSSILWRPGVAVVFDQDVPNGSGGYNNVGPDLGDIGYDLVHTGTSDGGIIWGYGVIGTIPTATDGNIGSKQWGLGPDVVLGKTGNWGSAGFVLGHQWDVAGWGESDLNLTTLNYFYTLTLTDGWTITSAPTLSYNHEATSDNALTVPLGVGIGKTAVLGGRPWQFRAEYVYNVVRPDDYAAEQTFRIAISPVFSTPWND